MISVIVPIYNVEEYLPACIESILNQTYKDLEILLIDDGSTDNSGKICDKYVKQDNRCIAIHQLNKGLSGARNTGLDHATGEYISFIDGDDYIHPQMFEILYEALQKGDYDFSMTLYKEVYNKEQFQLIPSYSSNEICQQQLIYGLYNSSNTNNNYPEINFHVVWNKLYKKNFIGTLSFIRTSSEDTVFINTLYLECKKAIVINQEMYYWVQRSTSITHQGIDKTYVYRLQSYYLCYQNIPNDNLPYRAVALDSLYKKLILFNLNIKDKIWISQLKEINETIKKETIIEFITNIHISTIHKIIYLLALYFPLFPNIYSNICKKLKYHSR